MYQEEFAAVGRSSTEKINFLRRNPLGYILASVLAGIYVGFGILLIFSIGGQLAGAPYTKLVMGMSFGIALSLVVLAGAELFTGNNFCYDERDAAKKSHAPAVIKIVGGMLCGELDWVSCGRNSLFCNRFRESTANRSIYRDGGCRKDDGGHVASVLSGSVVQHTGLLGNMVWIPMQK